MKYNKTIFSRMICVIVLLLQLFASGVQAGESRFSTAGFYELAGSGREVYNMNYNKKIEYG
ncbi:hypothetical protein [uncultured Bacteroides sp.]|uniref:hypothetical protein n=1 Tax=uncultured Bacteroides sp. TaxID=162156 RepID=UPI00262ED168|nr:hypothetical protein [uncultured Bacteroides sp.]